MENRTRKGGGEPWWQRRPTIRLPLYDVRESLNGACKRAGIPHVRVHGLRHTFGSQMAMAGADPFAIMKAMGHTDMKTTMIYVSLGKSHIRDQVDKLNSISLLPPHV